MSEPCPTPERQHYTAVSITAESARKLDDLIAAERKRTGYKVSKIDVLTRLIAKGFGK